MSPLAHALFALALHGPLAAAGGDDERPVIGDTIGRLAFVDLRYLPREVGELGDAEATVITFVSTSCPLAKRYIPRLVELEAEYAERGVRFLLVNVGAGDGVVEMASQAVEAGVSFPVGKDFDGSLARALGARRTPEVCVLDGERRLRYRGRVDEQYRLGGVRPDRGREYLREALEDLLAGGEVRTPQTEVDGCPISAQRAPDPGREVTWRDAGPIVERACMPCHRPGGDAPFDLVGWRDIADRGEVVREVIEQQRMPPWYASPDHGEFANERRMSGAERDVLLAWIDRDCPPGEGADDVVPAPEPMAEWRIGEPDLVIQNPFSIELPAEGYVPYKYSVLLRPFLEDTWVEAIEIRPANRRVLHHANLAYASIGQGYEQGNFITGQVPGGQPMDLRAGTAVLIPAGSVLGLQMHYVTTGVEESDRISVGLRFPRVPVEKRVRHVKVTNHRFEIPPGAPHHEVAARRTLPRDATGLGMFSHMHLRGKDMVFRAKYPDGTAETLLLIPNYSFDWQLAYVWEEGRQRFPAGTALECVAHFDNSAFNPYNPDPSVAVRFGPQTYHEMMYGFVFYTEDGENLGIEVEPHTGHVVEPRAGE